MSPPAVAAPALSADLLELTKPRITALVSTTAAAGFLLATPRGELPWLALVEAVVGIGLVSAGSGALNQYVERELDRRMRRTARRPLPAGRMQPDSALV
jgi:protoheme IX farnesyltransferase